MGSWKRGQKLYLTSKWTSADVSFKCCALGRCNFKCCCLRSLKKKRSGRKWDPGPQTWGGWVMWSLKSSHRTRAYCSGILTVMWSTRHSSTRENGCFWYRLMVQSWPWTGSVAKDDVEVLMRGRGPWSVDSNLYNRKLTSCSLEDSFLPSPLIQRASAIYDLTGFQERYMLNC